jgi:hypothetical protein
MNITLKQNRNDETKYLGALPAPELKSGARSFTLCVPTFHEFFSVPPKATDVRIILTKRVHPDAYELKYVRECRSSWPGVRWIYFSASLDGFDIGMLYDNAERAIKRAVDSGYKYVRVDYKEAE